MNVNENTGTGRQPMSWRRMITAIGAAAAIAIGGITMIEPQEAHAAGVRQPLVIQSSSPTVQSAQPATEDRD